MSTPSAAGTGGGNSGVDADPAGAAPFYARTAEHVAVMLGAVWTGLDEALSTALAGLHTLEAESLLTAFLARVTHLELTVPPVRHLNNTLRAWHALTAG